jgi:hypothetical protein
MAEVWKKLNLRIDRALGERLSEGVWRKLDRMVIADGAVREEEAPPPDARPVKKLSGKAWVKDHADEFDPDVVSITKAGGQLSAKSKTASDCAKPLSVGHCINLLRDLNRWGKKPRNPLKGPRHRRK